MDEFEASSNMIGSFLVTCFKYIYLDKLECFQFILDGLVAMISACQELVPTSAGDRGSIPRLGVGFCLIFCLPLSILYTGIACPRYGFPESLSSI